MSSRAPARGLVFGFWATDMLVELSLWMGGGVEEVSENSWNAEYVPVLYPSGTDFRTRMPTLNRFDCTDGGRGGDRASFVERE